MASPARRFAATTTCGTGAGTESGSAGKVVPEPALIVVTYQYSVNGVPWASSAAYEKRRAGGMRGRARPARLLSVDGEVLQVEQVHVERHRARRVRVVDAGRAGRRGRLRHGRGVGGKQERVEQRDSEGARGGHGSDPSPERIRLACTSRNSFAMRPLPCPQPAWEDAVLAWGARHCQQGGAQVPCEICVLPHSARGVNPSRRRAAASGTPWPRCPPSRRSPPLG